MIEERAMLTGLTLNSHSLISSKSLMLSINSNTFPTHCLPTLWEDYFYFSSPQNSQGLLCHPYCQMTLLPITRITMEWSEEKFQKIKKSDKRLCLQKKKNRKEIPQTPTIKSTHLPVSMPIYSLIVIKKNHLFTNIFTSTLLFHKSLIRCMYVYKISQKVLHNSTSIYPHQYRDFSIS